MPYITVPIKHKEYQITFEDILYGMKKNIFEDLKETFDTRTVYREATPARLLETIDLAGMYSCLVNFNEKHKRLIETENKAELYHSFKIPKRSGGLRPIDAPKEELMLALRELKYLFETKLYANYHTTAFAYIKGRCTIDAVKRHQKNNSRWFLKLDFSNFFGSTTLEFVMSQLQLMFPFNELMDTSAGKDAVRDALSLCFLNGGLPQGTPISPTLTNLMMIPVDHHIAREMREHTPHICYTRYADDLLLSADISFQWRDVQQKVSDILKKFNAPFSIKESKTRYGSSAGRNWNLGVMLNKDNQITIGHQKKKAFKAMLFSILNDYKNGVFWSIEDAQALGGLIAYYTMVEEEYIRKLVDEYSKKFGKNVHDVIKETLKQRISDSPGGLILTPAACSLVVYAGA